MMRISILLIICIYCIQYCPLYMCEPEKGNNVCNILTNQNEMPVFHIQDICKGDKICDLSLQFDQEDTCIIPHKKLLPGEKCNVGSQCYSGKCDECRGQCTGFLESDTCSTNEECDVGLYCDISKKCKLWKELAGECDVGIECASYLVCNNKKCVLPGSVRIGEVSTNPFACSTLYAAEISVGKTVCVNGPTRISEEACTGYCWYKLILPDESVLKVSEPGECGKDNTGESYCPRGLGDLKAQIEVVRR